MTAALPMGGQKITGMADPTVSTDGATKNYVDTTTAAFFSTGDVKLTFKTIADAGWLIFDDGTFGSASSGSSNRANADTQPLFNLLYNLADAWAPILTSGGGATTRAAQGAASAAWAANCRMTLPKTLGRAIAISGSGAGLSARPLGANTGEETHALTGAENGPHNHSGGTGVDTPDHSHSSPIAPSFPNVTQGAASTFTNVWIGAPANNGTTGGASGRHTHGIPTDGSGAAHNNMQPTAFMNAMVKL